ncbi:MAG: DUF4876 domain-containing protein [Alistipes sp.]|nr:DUF4876 domain-containing protein [Alistipes sp.]
MKRFFLFSAALALTVFTQSCKEDDKEIATVDTVTITVSMPADFPSTAAYQGEVTLQDRNSTRSYTATAVNGKAIFNDVMFGIYDASAAATLTHEEFAAAAPDLAANFSGSISLNGSLAMLSLIDQTASAEQFEINLTWAVPGNLVISKIYSFGTTNLNDKVYNLDKYWEIYNNSDQVQYVDGLYLGEAYGSAVSPSVYPDVAADPCCYLQRVVRFPGSGTQYPVEPGQSIVVAMNAKNHIDPEVITQTVDLSGADFECYVEDSTSFFPADNASVPNLEQIYGANTYAAKFGAGQGSIIVLFEMTDAEMESAEKVLAPGTDAYGAAYAYYCLAVPNSKVIDAVDCYRVSLESRKSKHLPTDVDASYAAIDQKGIADRKVAYITPDGRKVLQDTNNSSQDFVYIAPRTEGGADHIVPRDYDKAEIQPAL